MSDSNPLTGTAQDLGVPASEPSVPVISYAEAQSRKAEFFADKEKMAALMRDDVSAVAEWRLITKGLSAQPQTPTGPREEMTEHLNASSGYTLSDEVLQEFRDDRPVTPNEYRMARARFDSRPQDKEWIAKLNRGDLETKKELTLIQHILSRRVRDPQVQS